jgi:hypothetical protein
MPTITCTCGYTARDADDFDEHVIAMTRGDDTFSEPEGSHRPRSTR